MQTNSRYVSLFGNLNAKYGSKNITPTTLRMEVALATGNTYNFNIKETQNKYPTEKRLDNSTLFYPVEYGFFVSKRVITNNVPIEAGNFETFPNPNIFPNATELRALNNWYNSGVLNITIGATVLTENLSLNRFLYIDEAQQGLAQSTVVLTGVTPRSSFNRDKCFHDIVPALPFSGDTNIKINIELPDGLENNAASQVQGTQNIFTLVFEGFQIIDGAQMIKG